MLVLQTLIVYLSFWGIIFFFLKRASVSKSQIYIFFAAIAFSVISGLRYGVGYDFYSYMKNYVYFHTNGFFLAESELGFEYLTRFISKLNFGYGAFFAVIGFLQLFFILRSLQKDRYIYPFFAFTFVTSCIWLSYFNGVRQTIAFSLFSYALFFIVKRKYIEFLILIIIATFFHKSAILLLLFFPIVIKKKEWVPNVKLQLFLLFCAVMLMNINIIQNFISQFEGLISLLGYDVYLEERYSEKFQNSESLKLGMGFIITLLTNFLLIAFSAKTKEWIKSEYFTMIYNFSFWGIIINYSFFNSHLIIRLNWYLNGFVYITGAFIIYYLFHNKKIWFSLLTTLFLLTFIATMYKMEDNTSLYIFNFQEELFYIKDQKFL